MKTRRTILLLLCCAAGLAAGPANSSETPPPMFRTLGLGFATSGLFYLIDDEEVFVTVTEDARSGFLVRPAGDEVEFFQKATLPDGSQQNLSVARVSLADGGTLPLLVFSPPAGEQKIPSVEVLNDSLEEFPGGSYRILNQLNVNLGIIVGQARAEVPARSQRVLGKRDGEAGKTVLFQAYVQTSGGPQMVFSNNWAFGDRLRTLVVVTPPATAAERPFFRRIVEPADVLLSARAPLSTTETEP